MKRGQSTIEYALLIAVVAAAFLAMQLYVQRAVQANFKLIEDQINAEPLEIGSQTTTAATSTAAADTSADKGSSSKEMSSLLDELTAGWLDTTNADIKAALGTIKSNYQDFILTSGESISSQEFQAAYQAAYDRSENDFTSEYSHQVYALGQALADFKGRLTEK